MATGDVPVARELDDLSRVAAHQAREGAASGQAPPHRILHDRPAFPEGLEDALARQLPLRRLLVEEDRVERKVRAIGDFEKLGERVQRAHGFSRGSK
jgi:hypothetical protein